MVVIDGAGCLVPLGLPGQPEIERFVNRVLRQIEPGKMFTFSG